MTHDRRTFLRAIGVSGIGAMTYSGTALGATGSFTVEGAGADIWDSADAFHYYFTEVTGDFDVTVEVANVENTDSWAKAGLMLRESLSADAANAMVRKTPGNDTSFSWRSEAGGSAESTTSDGGDVARNGGSMSATYQRLVRSGNTIEAYGSTDGSNWTKIAQLDAAPIPDEAYIGLAVTSASSGTLCSAEFADPSGFSPTYSVDVGDVGTAGSVTATGGSVTVTPLLSEASVSQLGRDAATLHGQLAGLGNGSSASVYFEYRETGSGSWSSTTAQSLSSAGSFSQSLSGLAGETEYEYRAVAEDSDGDRDTTATQTFTTFGPDTSPSIVTEQPSAVEDSWVTVSANLETLGGHARSGDVYFEYREAGGSWERTEVQTVTESGSVGRTVFDLSPQTEYEVRATVEADDGETATGGTVSFTTSASGGSGAGSYFGLDDGFADPAPWLTDDVTVYKVTEPTRAAVAEAFTATEPRVVVFETSGVIDLQEKMLRVQPKCWVAGQTAPSPGITFINGKIKVHSDCVVQHVRSFRGEGTGSGEGKDPMNSADQSENVVIDHVSAFWGRDENLTVGYNSSTTTFSNNLIAEGLTDPTENSNGTLVGDNAKEVALLGNVYAKNYDRNPRMKDGTEAAIVNNLVYYFNKAVNHDASATSSVVGNAFLRPYQPSDPVVRGGSAYLEDNFVAEPSLESGQAFSTASGLGSRPLWPTNLEALSSDEVESHNLQYAGARPADRIEHEKRVLDDVRNRSGDWVPNEPAVGGFPSHGSSSHSVPVPDSGLRAWLEEWALWAEEPGRSKPTVDDGGGDDQAPETPSGLAVTGQTETSVSVAWNGSADSGGSGLAEYVVSVDGQQRTTVGANTTSATVSGLQSDTQYEIGVAAVDGAGNESGRARTTATTSGDGGATQTISPSFSMDSVSVDGSAEATITLDSAPDGLAGFDLTVSVDDTSVATIEGASYANDLFEQGIDVATDGSSVSLQAVDANENVQSGAGEVDLATVSLQAQGAGEATISVTVDGLDADGGAAISASTTTDTLSVTETTVSELNGVLPRDNDGDGNYEDLNANGRLDSDDVVVYFNNYDQPAITDHVSAYDFNDSGSIDFDDIVTLFNQL